MKRFFGLSSAAALFFIATPLALASDAQTSATAGSNSLRPNGTAAAAAHYEGQVGFARTQTQSGRVNLARGVAVGVDKQGLSLSVSHAVAPRLGPAVGSNFSLSIGRDGEVSKNHSIAVARGPIEREVTVGGQAGSHRFGSTASGIASGRTDPFGRVQASSDSRVSRPLARVARIIHR
jgi:hypothetical protein